MNKLDLLLDRVTKLEKKYYKSYNYYTFMNNLLVLPSIALTSLASIFSFLSNSELFEAEQKSDFLVAVAIITALSSLLQTISGSCEFSVKKNQFNQAANEFNSLVDKISFEILDKDEEDFISTIEEEIKRIKEACKFLP